MSFGSRRVRKVVLLLVAAALVLVIEQVGSTALHKTSYPSGWSLLIVVLGLASYSVRKRLAALPLGRSATWLQLHVYTGLLSGVIFGVHVRWRIPSGGLERCLALLFVLVFSSGVFGFVFSRVSARRLGTQGGEVLFERIARLRYELRSQVEHLVLNGLELAESTAVVEFYTERLQPFFDGPRHFWLHLAGSDRPVRRLMGEIDRQDRYTNDAERKLLRQIADRVRRKNNLDFQSAHQTVLRCWLLVHVPLTWALLLVASFHILLIHAYIGVG